MRPGSPEARTFTVVALRGQLEVIQQAVSGWTEILHWLASKGGLVRRGQVGNSGPELWVFHSRVAPGLGASFFLHGGRFHLIGDHCVITAGAALQG
ncbi:hypothetical protein [Deinococcus ficus]|uniref:hypothetical protein n=1 Tax=Deinococcus ficus TaxID=317577 RepID=UPI0004122E9E|nr:hypothetical protein [Deinococcus ficus]